MSNNYAGRSSNVPYAFNPTTNHSPPPPAECASPSSTTQDRLIVGVDFGTTYSGMVHDAVQNALEAQG